MQAEPQVEQVKATVVCFRFADFLTKETYLLCHMLLFQLQVRDRRCGTVFAFLLRCMCLSKHSMDSSPRKYQGGHKE